MRWLLLTAALLAAPAGAHAQDAPGVMEEGGAEPAGGALSAEGYVALSADQRAQISLDGLRAYLERTRASDEALYDALDPPLAELESRETTADVIFWTATGLSLAALIGAIPAYELAGEDLRTDLAVGLLVGGVSTFVLGLIVQAILRPGHGDLVRLIDRHDELLGRR